MKKVILSIFLIILFVRTGISAQLFYMYSTDYKKDENDPYKYHFSNAFDNDEKTLWCFEHSPGGREEIILYFPKTVELKRITIKNGINPKINKDMNAGGVKEIELIGEFSKNTIYLEENLLSKSLSLLPPIATNRVVIAITDVYNKESDLICIRDIQIMGTPDNLISTASPKIYKQKAEESRFWGKWQGGTSEGAYEKFIFLGMEGNYLFVYSPFDPDLKGFKASGTYSIKDDELIIKYKNEKIVGKFQDTDSARQRLIIEDDRFKGTYYFEP
ncbi:MAG: NADase-type glycan-binding domain-containing protein [Myxococcota bacterium]